MALSGSLREFSLSEILQLLSSQRKTGSLRLTRGQEARVVYLLEGRVAAVRDRGLPTDDPLATFLRRVHRLSEEQMRGIGSIHAESGRDLVDLLLNGRYIEREELGMLYERLVPDDALPERFRSRMKRWKCGSGTFRMNLALSELPSFTALPGREMDDHHTAGIILAPSLAYMDRAYDDARKFGWSREPIVEMLIPSTLDDSLAPKGAHVASLFCQHVAPELPDGKSWDDHRDEIADLMIATVDRFAPGFKKSVIARKSLTPLDLERDFGLIGGDIFHGAMSLDQIFSARPMLGYADYRSPITGLYLCGSGTHPGGGVTGAPGHNAAKVIAGDLGRRR